MDSTKDASSQLAPEVVASSLAVIQDIFRQFRPLVLERAGKSIYTDKHDGSPVTDTDMEIEKALQAAFMDRFPDVPIFGEETGYGTDLPAAFWLIDPIDGTKSFVEGVPTFTCMAVLIQEGEATASIIYNPSSDDMYVAQKGKGAYKNKTHLNLHTTRLPRVAYCKSRFIGTLDNILKPKNVSCTYGIEGGGYGFTMVADGLSAARFNLKGGGYTHDYAPGALLVREAGGAIVPVKDDTYTYETRSFVACHPDLETILRSHVHELRTMELEM